MKPETDRLKASATTEFVWDTSEHTEIHKFILGPITKILNQYKVETILDIGCGNGSFTGLLAKQNYSIVGMDHSLSGISIAQNSFDKLKFEQHDILDKLNETHHECYDAVISVEVIEHVLLPRKLIENALYALKPGGVFILTTPYHGFLKNLALALTNKFDDHWHPLRDYGHIKFFSKSTITELFCEFNLQEIQFSTVGRIPAFARSMIISGIKPK